MSALFPELTQLVRQAMLRAASYRGDQVRFIDLLNPYGSLHIIDTDKVHMTLECLHPTYNGFYNRTFWFYMIQQRERAEPSDISVEYLELIIQFGWLSMFVVVFPLAPLFCLANNLLEMRIDAAKLIRYWRMPEPR